ncbi:hypothetical protein [Sphingobacterium griseoflavum]|uniref:hypothetical protein n=1 Tax=Sphingobacterium griseoflavum TaxID=1474952 RepID=UPI0036426EAE
MAEHQFGKGRGYADPLVVNVNWAVGLGMVICNQLYREHRVYAGEFSHIPLANSQKLQRQLPGCSSKGYPKYQNILGR